MIVKLFKEGSNSLYNAFVNSVKTNLIQNLNYDEAYKILGVEPNDSMEKINDHFDFLHERNSKKFGGSKFIHEKIKDAYDMIKEKKAK